MATWKPQLSDQPTVDDPKDSRAKRLERQQSRFRDRGGIFVPSNRNTLLDVLLSRTMSVDSPRTVAASSNAARRRSQSSSPLRRPSYTPRETPSTPRGRSSDIHAYNDAPVSSPSRSAKAGKVAGSERHSGKDDAKMSKVSKGKSAKRGRKSRPPDTARPTDVGADHLRPDTSSTSEGESSYSRKSRPKAKAPPARSKGRLSTIVESENEGAAAVEPPPRKKSKGPARRSRSLSPESEQVEHKEAVKPLVLKKPKGRPKRAVSRVETGEAVEEPVRSSTSKSKGKGKKPAVSKREILDNDEEPDVLSKAKKPSRPVPSKKGPKKNQPAPPKASPLPDPPVPLDPDPGVRTTSRNDKDDPLKKARKSEKRQQEQADAFEDPQPPRKRPKSQPADASDVKPKMKFVALNDEPDLPSKKPLKSKKRQQQAEEDTFEDPPPQKRLKSQPADDNGAKPVKKSAAIKDEPKGKIPSSKVLKENTANKDLPLKVANKLAKTKKPVSKRKSRHLPKVILERIQRSLNESHEVDDEPDPINFLS